MAGSRTALLVACLALLAGCTSTPTDPLASIKFATLSGPMPSLGGPGLGGGMVEPAGYSGKVVLVNFWSSSCAPCTREMPALQSVWKEMEPAGTVTFIGVDYQDQRGAALSFLRRFGVTYPSVSDPSGSVGARFRVQFLPTTILADGEGRLRYRLVGAQDPNVIAYLIRGLEGT